MPSLGALLGQHMKFADMQVVSPIKATWWFKPERAGESGKPKRADDGVRASNALAPSLSRMQVQPAKRGGKSEIAPNIGGEVSDNFPLQRRRCWPRRRCCKSPPDPADRAGTQKRVVVVCCAVGRGPHEDPAGSAPRPVPEERQHPRTPHPTRASPPRLPTSGKQPASAAG